MQYRLNKIVELMLKDVRGVIEILIEDSHKDVKEYIAEIKEYMDSIQPLLVKAAEQMIEDDLEQLERLSLNSVREYLPLDIMQCLFDKIFLKK